MVSMMAKRKFDDSEDVHQTYAPAKVCPSPPMDPPRPVCSFIWPHQHTKVAPVTEPIITEDIDMGMEDAPSPAPSLASLATTASSQGSRELYSVC